MNQEPSHTVSEYTQSRGEFSHPGSGEIAKEAISVPGGHCHTQCMNKDPVMQKAVELWGCKNGETRNMQ